VRICRRSDLDPRFLIAVFGSADLKLCTMIVLTGFEPFAGDTHNPSGAVAAALDGCVLNGVRVQSATLPVDGLKVGSVLEAVISDDVQALVMLGLARGRMQIALERVALNWAEYRLPDNAGLMRRGERLNPDAPDAFLSTLPLEEILSAWREAGVPGYVSDSAGLYLCNQVFYTARQRFPAIPVGFIHLPSDETLALHKIEPFVPLEFQIRGVRIALEKVAVGVLQTL
jgi:pyroglutamyl-peptidase